MISRTFRIAIFSDNFYPELGGIQDSILTLGKELAVRGHEICFYVPRYGARDYAMLNLPAQELDLGPHIQIRRFGAFPFPSPTLQSRLVVPVFLRWLRTKSFRPDVIHTHTFFGVGLEALAAAYVLKIPLVGTNHWAISEFQRYMPLRFAWFIRGALKYVSWYYNRARLITAPSRSVLQEMTVFGLRAPSRIISNPIATELFRPREKKDISRIKKQWGLSPHTIVFAGRLGAEKNVDILIKAIALVQEKCKDVLCAIAGHGSDEARLKALSTSLRLTRHIKFLGSLEKPALAEVFSASEVFAIASTSETQSMVLLQAMASGIPGVGARWRALKEYITAKNGLLFAPHDVRDLAEKLLVLLKNDRRRRALGAHARKFAEMFRASAIAEEWEKIYDEVKRGYTHERR